MNTQAIVDFVNNASTETLMPCPLLAAYITEVYPAAQRIVLYDIKHLAKYRLLNGLDLKKESQSLKQDSLMLAYSMVERLLAWFISTGNPLPNALESLLDNREYIEMLLNDEVYLGDQIKPTWPENLTPSHALFEQVLRSLSVDLTRSYIDACIEWLSTKPVEFRNNPSPELHNALLDKAIGLILQDISELSLAA